MIVAISLTWMCCLSSKSSASLIGHNACSSFSSDCSQENRMWLEMVATSLWNTRQNDISQKGKLPLKCGKRKLSSANWKYPWWYFTQLFEYSNYCTPSAQDFHLTYLIIIPIWKLHKNYNETPLPNSYLPKWLH